MRAIDSVPHNSRPVLAAIALGSNVGDRAAHLEWAVERLHRLPLTSVRTVSSSYDTAPVGGPIGGPTQGRYLNAAALLDTLLTPRDLLGRLLAIEHDRGRRREPGVSAAPRTLDLDLLTYGRLVLDEPGLTLPHPRMLDRTFVLMPLAEIAPALEIQLPNGRVVTTREALRRFSESESRG